MKPLSGPLVLGGVLLLLTSALSPLRAAPLDTVVCQGETVTGIGSPLTFVTPSAMGPQGQIVVRVQYQGSGGTEVALITSSGVGAPFSTLIKQGDTPTGGPGPLTGFGSLDVSVAADGSAAFIGNLDTGGSSTGAILAGSAGSVEALAYLNMPRPEVATGAIMSSLTQGALYNSAGQIAYSGKVNIPNVGSFEDVLWFGAAGSEQPILQEDQFYSGMPPNTTVKQISGFLINNQGDLWVQMEIRYDDPMIDDAWGIWHYSGGSFTPVVLERETANASGISGSGTWTNRLTILDAADNGWLLFRGETSDSNQALFLEQGGAIQEVIPDATVTVPGTGGAQIEFASGFRHSVSPTGRVVFGEFLKEGTGSPAVTFSDNTVLLAWEGGSLSVLLREGDNAPGFGGLEVIRTLGAHDMNPNGQVFVACALDDGPQREGIWAESSPGSFQLVAIEDDLFEDADANMREIDVLSYTNTQGNGTNGLPNVVDALGQVLFRVNNFSDFPLPDVTCILVGSVPPFTLPGSISGAVRNDVDRDGDPADSDAGISGLTVNLYQDDGMGGIAGPALQTTSTGLDGTFSFSNVAPNDYLVEAVASQQMLDDSHSWTLPPSIPGGAIRPVSVATAQMVEDVVFLSNTPGSITGIVQEDTNGDDAADAPLAGVTVTLSTNPGGSFIDTATTDASGQFSFAGVFAGDYFLDETDPNNYVSVSDSFGANDNRIEVTVSSGQASGGNQFLDRFQSVYDITLRAASPGGTRAITLESETESFYDEPLELVTSPTALELQPEVQKGLVADGITPLIIEISTGISLPIGATLDWQASVISGGDLFSDPYLHMKILNGGSWLRADSGQLNEVEISAGANPRGYLQIDSLEAENLEFTGGAKELVLRIELLDPGTGQLVGRRDIQLRRPILGIAPSYDAAPPTQGFLDAIGIARPADFIHVLDPASIVDRPLDGFMNDWAYTQIDLIAQGRIGLSYLEVSKPGRFGRVPFRRMIGLGVPHRGSTLAVYLRRLEERLLEINAVGGGSNFIPRSLTQIPGWSNLTTTLPGSALSSHPRDIFRLYNDDSFKNTALIHHVGTRVDATNAPALAAVGLSGTAYDTVTGGFSDGFVDTVSALAGLTPQQDLGVSLISSSFIAHDQPAADLGGQQSLLDTNVGLGAAAFIDNSLAAFERYKQPEPLGEDRIREIEMVAEQVVAGVPLDIVALVLPSPPTASSAPDAPPNGLGSTDYSFEITPAAGFPVVGDVFWFAEVLGPNGPTTQGLTVTPDSVNPLQVTVTVDGSVIGEVLLYVSYQTTDDKIVIGTPKVVVTLGPMGATVTGIQLDPDGLTFNVGDFIVPEVTVLYSDGSQFQRTLTATDVTSISSSSAAVIDVTNSLSWSALAEGSSTITLSAFGQSDTATLSVVDPFPPQTRDQWKQERYSASELLDPLVSGDGVDLDGDTVTVHFEYLTGGSDGDSDSAALPFMTVDENGVGLTARISTRLSGVEKLEICSSTDLVTPVDNWNVFFDFADPIDLADPRIRDFRDYGEYLEVDFAVPSSPGMRSFFKLRETFPPYGPPTGTTVLTFVGAAFGLGGYGDNVTGTFVNPYSYGGIPNFTPNITSQFTAGVAAGTVIGGQPINVLGSDSFGFISVILTAASGYLIELESFDLVVRANRATAPTISTVTVRDGDNTTVVGDTNVTIPVNDYLHYDFTSGSPLITDRVVIVLNANNLPNLERDDIGITNIRFSQREDLSAP